MSNRFVAFDEIIADHTRYAKKIPKEHYLLMGKYPIIDQGQEYIAGYSNDRHGIFNEVPAIIFGDHTRILKYIDFPFFLGADGVKLLKNRNKNVECKYLYYCLLNSRIPNTGYNRHFKWLKEIQIMICPIEKQKKIIDILDKAKSLIDLRKKQIEKMDLLIKSKFIEMFGDPVTNPKKWRVVTFAEVATIDTHMTTDWEKYNGLPHIGIENIEKDTGHITKLKLVRDSELISGKYIFDKRHIIYSKIRPNLNKVALPDFTGVCSADAYPILPKSNTTRYYLAFILRSQHFLDYILSHSDRTNIPKVNKKQLAGFELPLPPVEDQNSFTLFVDSVEEQKYMLQHGLHKMEINYKSLMQEYFG
ncbi:MAG: restriction endonuclease subunit S [Methanomethylovorans sp.]|nr:restriction endonuclease subunit S [Methanomethylovorans sp.]